MTRRRGKFSLAEQVWMQLSFQGVWILGAAAIFRQSPLLSLGYVALFPVLGVIVGIMRHWVCPRCPHLEGCGSCVQVPPALARRIVKAREAAVALNTAEKVGFFVALYGVPLVPLYWVSQQPGLAIPYAVFVAMHYGAYFAYFCRRCLNVHCPQNLSGRAVRTART